MKHVIKYKIKGYTLIVTLRKGFKKKSATITMENAPRTKTLHYVQVLLKIIKNNKKN